jgi:hypothetical protein
MFVTSENALCVLWEQDKQWIRGKSVFESSEQAVKVVYVCHLSLTKFESDGKYR